MTLRILCINKKNHHDIHDHIQFVGGLNQDGSRWKLSQAETIQRIEKGDTFYVEVGSDLTTVKVLSRNGNKYIRTQTDSTKVDNLLSLPECP